MCFRIMISAIIVSSVSILYIYTKDMYLNKQIISVWEIGGEGC